MAAEEFWKAFHETYAGAPGLIHLSPVGFNDRRDQAFFYFGAEAGRLMGAGGYLLLKKHDTGWRIEGGSTLWMS